MRTMCIVLAVCAMSSGAVADIIFTVPDAEVSPTDTILSLVVTGMSTVDNQGLTGFNAKFDIAGPPGCTFTGAQKPPEANYILPGGGVPASGNVINAGRSIEEIADVVFDPPFPVLPASATRDVVQLDFAFSGIALGDVFTISFDAASTNDTNFYDDLGYDIFGVYGTGTITVTPEPATMSVLALGGLVLIRRRRRA